MNLFNLVATLFLDDDNYKKGLEDAKNETKELGNETDETSKKSVKSIASMVSAIGLAIGAVYGLANQFINFGSDIDDNAQKLGISTEAYQLWTQTLKLNGADISSLDTAMKQLTTIVDGASNGVADNILMFDKLGIKFEDIKDLSPEDQLKAVVEAFQELEPSVGKTQSAFDFFGTSGQELLPLLNAESGSIDKLWDSFYDLGLIIDDEGIKKSTQMGDQLDILTAQFQVFTYQIGEVLSPIMSNLFTAFSWIFEEIEKGNPIVIALGVALSVVAVAWAVFNAPIIAIVAAIALLIAGIVELVENWDIVTETFQKGWEVTKSIFKSGVDFIINYWTGIANVLTEPFLNLWDNIKNIFDLIKSSFSDLFSGDFSGFTDGMGDIFKALLNTLIGGINDVINVPLKLINNVLSSIKEINILGVEPFTFISEIPTINIPRLKMGMDFVPSDNYMANLDYGERVLTKEENSKYMALGGVEGIMALVNGISGSIRNNNNNNDNNQPINIVVNIGNKKLEDFTFTAVNNKMKNKGYKNLTKVGAY